MPDPPMVDFSDMKTYASMLGATQSQPASPVPIPKRYSERSGGRNVFIIAMIPNPSWNSSFVRV